jgi:hypothetical protein
MFLFRFAAYEKQNSLYRYLPSEALLSMRINNDVLIKRMVYDFLFQADFEKSELDQLVFKSDGVSLPGLGIDVSREIMLFYERWQKKDLVGWLVHIRSAEQFDNFQFEKSNIIKARSGNVGCILILAENPMDEEILLFAHYAEDILIPTKDLSETKRYFEKEPPRSMIQLFFEGEPGSFLQKSGLSIGFNQSELTITGSGKRNPLVDYELKEQHYIVGEQSTPTLEIRAGVLPDTLSKYLQFIFDEANIQLPVIQSQQIIIESFGIENIKGRMAVLPNFNGIFRFEDPIRLSTILGNMDGFGTAVKDLTENSFRIENVTYHCKQLSDNELFIGINPNAQIEKLTDNRFFLMAGNAASLFTIEGKGFVAQFAQLTPEVKNSKHFLNSVEQFEVFAVADEENGVNIEGRMRFPNGKLASIEFLKYIIRF